MNKFVVQPSESENLYTIPSDIPVFWCKINLCFRVIDIFRSKIPAMPSRSQTTYSWVVPFLVFGNKLVCNNFYGMFIAKKLVPIKRFATNTRSFGDQIPKQHFAQSPLSRVNNFRESPEFLKDCENNQKSKTILFHNLKPLIFNHKDGISPYTTSISKAKELAAVLQVQ
jgi:hypothetical protein